MQGQLLGPRRVHAERLRVRRRLERRRLRHAALRSGRGGQGVQRARRMRGRSVQLLPGLRRPRLRRQARLPGRRQLLRAWPLPRRRPDGGGRGAARRAGRLLHVRCGVDGARVRGRGPRLQAGTPAPIPRPTSAPTTIRTSAPVSPHHHHRRNPTQGCSGNGRCEGGACTCFASWTGPTCDTKVCPRGGPRDAPCSGHGYCSPQGVCECADGYQGDDCSYSPGCPDGCLASLGRGACVGSPGRCKCAEGYEGANCGSRRCPRDCSGHGTCDRATGICLW